MNIVTQLKKLKSDFSKDKVAFIKKLVMGLGIAILGGLLGAWGGADGTSKAWRRVGLTIIYTVYGLIRLFNWWALVIVAVLYPLSKGYGIPCPVSGDEGSSIGRFWYKVFQLYPEQKRHLFADIATRSTIALMIMSSVIIAPILKATWGNYFLYSLPILAVWAFVSWRGLKTFEFLGKKLGWSEMITWSITTFCIIKIIG